MIRTRQLEYARVDQACLSLSSCLSRLEDMIITLRDKLRDCHPKGIALDPMVTYLQLAIIEDELTIKYVDESLQRYDYSIVFRRDRREPALRRRSSTLMFRRGQPVDIYTSTEDEIIEDPYTTLKYLEEFETAITRLHDRALIAQHRGGRKVLLVPPSDYRFYHNYDVIVAIEANIARHEESFKDEEFWERFERRRRRNTEAKLKGEEEAVFEEDEDDDIDDILEAYGT